MVNSNDIQLVLMDVMMPQMDGITAMAKIRESEQCAGYHAYGKE